MPPTPPPPPQQQQQPLADQQQEEQLLHPSNDPLPRFVLYAQTHHKPGPQPQEPVSLLPLITHNTGVTHVIVAAIHLNEGAGNITLNDDPPDSPKFDTLWAEVGWLQGAGVKVMGMLGGAAKGSYQRLQGSAAEFEAYYTPLRDLIRRRRLDGLDLDVEEAIALPTLLRLLARLRADFGPSFLTTLAPVATALVPDMRLPPTSYVPSDPATGLPTAPPMTLPQSLPHLSGFNHFALEAGHGALVSWYNAQFYNGWGDARDARLWEAVVAAGWPPQKVVLGVLTNAGNGGSGFVECRVLEDVLRVCRAKFPQHHRLPGGAGPDARCFGGVMGWEYFNAGSRDGGAEGACGRGDYDDAPRESRPWEWAKRVGRVVRRALPPAADVDAGRGVERSAPPAHVPVAPEPQVPWPEAVEQLVELGFGRQRAVAALNATEGNVEMAAGLLFEQ
ncbi:glycoside hydrolase family 18 protein [Diplodia corticola]|uniref:Glycoside hydrolase family 18 protein n=1 Tax=Diplodia corticola TaxID=236234 RepID=A0A1J9QN53_9PEZI|nr:glycoside hydrolase family 18 protein [Diplodia corticola]OJD30326.1 glycoside hydrolase family 18 protein [Diplodia corticola]